MEWPIEIAELQEVCRVASRIALEGFGTASFERKGDGSPVTELDRRVEAFLRDELTRRAPSVPVIGEEGGGTVEAEGFAWVLDPIDGTRAFVAGIPCWCVSVGLLHDAEPVLGVITLPAIHGGEQIVGGFDVPLTRAGRPAGPVGPSDCGGVCALVPSDAHRRYDLGLPGRVRSLGSTAYHLALVATGSALAALVHESHLWDVAGAMALLRAVDVPFEHLDGSPLSVAPLLDGRMFPGPLLASPRWAWADIARQIHPLGVGWEGADCCVR